MEADRVEGTVIKHDMKTENISFKKIAVMRVVSKIGSDSVLNADNNFWFRRNE